VLRLVKNLFGGLSTCYRETARHIEAKTHCYITSKSLRCSFRMPYAKFLPVSKWISGNLVHTTVSLNSPGVAAVQKRRQKSTLSLIQHHVIQIKAVEVQLNALSSKLDGHYVVGVMPHPLDPHPLDRVLGGSRNRLARYQQVFCSLPEIEPSSAPAET